MTTRFADAIAALVTAYEGASAGASVYLGPNPQAASDETFAVVGHDGTLEADGTLSPDSVAGTFTQSWLEMPGTQQETGSINCVLVCQSGDATAIPSLYSAAGTLLAALEAAAAAGGGFAGGLTDMTFDGTASGRWVNLQSLAGAAVIVAYRVSYSTEW